MARKESPRRERQRREGSPSAERDAQRRRDRDDSRGRHGSRERNGRDRRDRSRSSDSRGRSSRPRSGHSLHDRRRSRSRSRSRDRPRSRDTDSPRHRDRPSDSRDAPSQDQAHSSSRHGDESSHGHRHSHRDDAERHGRPLERDGHQGGSGSSSHHKLDGTSKGTANNGGDSGRSGDLAREKRDTLPAGGSLRASSSQDHAEGESAAQRHSEAAIPRKRKQLSGDLSSGNAGGSRQSAPEEPMSAEEEEGYRGLVDYLSSKGISTDAVKGWRVRVSHRAGGEPVYLYEDLDGVTYERRGDVRRALEARAGAQDGDAQAIGNGSTGGGGGASSSVLTRLECFQRAKEALARETAAPENPTEAPDLEDWGKVAGEGALARPLLRGDMYVLSLGRVDARPAFHDAAHIWPVGYCSLRVAVNFTDHSAGRPAVLRCSTGDRGGFPLFRVEVEDAGNKDADGKREPAVVEARTESEAWKLALRALCVSPSVPKGERGAAILGGQSFFVPAVQHLIEGLDGSLDCAGYRFQEQRGDGAMHEPIGRRTKEHLPSLVELRDRVVTGWRKGVHRDVQKALKEDLKRRKEQEEAEQGAAAKEEGGSPRKRMEKVRSAASSAELEVDSFGGDHQQGPDEGSAGTKGSDAKQQLKKRRRVTSDDEEDDEEQEELEQQRSQEIDEKEARAGKARGEREAEGDDDDVAGGLEAKEGSGKKDSAAADAEADEMERESEPASPSPEPAPKKKRGRPKRVPSSPKELESVKSDGEEEKGSSPSSAAKEGDAAELFNERGRPRRAAKEAAARKVSETSKKKTKKEREEERKAVAAAKAAEKAEKADRSPSDGKSRVKLPPMTEEEKKAHRAAKAKERRLAKRAAEGAPSSAPSRGGGGGGGKRKGAGGRGDDLRATTSANVEQILSVRRREAKNAVIAHFDQLQEGEVAAGGAPLVEHEELHGGAEAATPPPEPRASDPARELGIPGVGMERLIELWDFARTFAKPLGLGSAPTVEELRSAIMAMSPAEAAAALESDRAAGIGGGGGSTAAAVSKTEGEGVSPAKAEPMEVVAPVPAAAGAAAAGAPGAGGGVENVEEGVPTSSEGGAHAIEATIAKDSVEAPQSEAFKRRTDAEALLEQLYMGVTRMLVPSLHDHIGRPCDEKDVAGGNRMLQVFVVNQLTWPELARQCVVMRLARDFMGLSLPKTTDWIRGCNKRDSSTNKRDGQWDRATTTLLRKRLELLWSGKALPPPRAGTSGAGSTGAGGAVPMDVSEPIPEEEAVEENEKEEEKLGLPANADSAAAAAAAESAASASNDSVGASSAAVAHAAGERSSAASPTPASIAGTVESEGGATPVAPPTPLHPSAASGRQLASPSASPVPPGGSSAQHEGKDSDNEDEEDENEREDQAATGMRQQLLSLVKNEERSEELRRCAAVMLAIMRHPYSFFFTTITRTTAHEKDYFEIVATPVTIESIVDNLESGTYERDPKGLVAALLVDLRLMWENCWCYNSESSDACAAATRMAAVTERLFREWLWRASPLPPSLLVAAHESEPCARCGKVIAGLPGGEPATVQAPKRAHLFKSAVECTGCDGIFHFRCCRPPAPPAQGRYRSEWFCNYCIDPNAAAAAIPPQHRLPLSGYGCGARAFLAGATSSLEPPLFGVSEADSALLSGSEGNCGIGGMTRWGPFPGLPGFADWSLSRKIREMLRCDGDCRLLHDAIRLLGRREGGYLPSPSAWTPAERVVVLSALASLALGAPRVLNHLAEAELRRENLRKRGLSLTPAGFRGMLRSVGGEEAVHRWDQDLESAGPEAKAFDDAALYDNDDEEDVGKVVGQCSKCKEGTAGAREPVLLCDGCGAEWHLRCAHLTAVPEGAWFCFGCIKRDKSLAPKEKAGGGKKKDAAAAAASAAAKVHLPKIDFEEDPKAYKERRARETILTDEIVDYILSHLKPKKEEKEEEQEDGDGGPSPKKKARTGDKGEAEGAEDAAAAAAAQNGNADASTPTVKTEALSADANSAAAAAAPAAPNEGGPWSGRRGRPPKQRSKRRCGMCEGCLAPDCNKCRFCKDMRKNGGPNTLRQPCLQRRCHEFGGEEVVLTSVDWEADFAARKGRGVCAFCGLPELSVCSSFVRAMAPEEMDQYIEKKMVPGKPGEDDKIPLPHFPLAGSKDSKDSRLRQKPLVHERCAANMFKARAERSQVHSVRQIRERAMDEAERLSGYRTTPLGQDRFGSLYFHFQGDPGRVYACAPTGKQEEKEDLEAAAADTRAHESDASVLAPAPASGSVWRVYERPSDLEALLAWLDPRGRREKHLRDVLMKELARPRPELKKEDSLLAMEVDEEQPKGEASAAEQAPGAESSSQAADGNAAAAAAAGAAAAAQSGSGSAAAAKSNDSKDASEDVVDAGPPRKSQSRPAEGPKKVEKAKGKAVDAAAASEAGSGDEGADGPAAAENGGAHEEDEEEEQEEEGDEPAAMGVMKQSKYKIPGRAGMLGTAQLVGEAMLQLIPAKGRVPLPEVKVETDDGFDTRFNSDDAAQFDQKAWYALAIVDSVTGKILQIPPHIPVHLTYNVELNRRVLITEYMEEPYKPYEAIYYFAALRFAKPGVFTIKFGVDVSDEALERAKEAEKEAAAELKRARKRALKKKKKKGAHESEEESNEDEESEPGEEAEPSWPLSDLNIMLLLRTLEPVVYTVKAVAQTLRTGASAALHKLRAASAVEKQRKQLTAATGDEASALALLPPPQLDPPFGQDEIEALKTALAAVMLALPEGTLKDDSPGDSSSGASTLRGQLLASVASASDAPRLMELVLLFESSIDPKLLKPWYVPVTKRLQDPMYLLRLATPAAVALRIFQLDNALSYDRAPAALVPKAAAAAKAGKGEAGEDSGALANAGLSNEAAALLAHNFDHDLAISAGNGGRRGKRARGGGGGGGNGGDGGEESALPRRGTRLARKSRVAAEAAMARGADVMEFDSEASGQDENSGPEENWAGESDEEQQQAQGGRKARNNNNRSGGDASDGDEQQEEEGGGAGSEPRVKEWTCPSCTVQNPLEAKICTVCQSTIRPPELSPELVAQRGARSRGGGGGGGRNKRRRAAAAADGAEEDVGGGDMFGARRKRRKKQESDEEEFQDTAGNNSDEEEEEFNSGNDDESSEEDFETRGRSRRSGGGGGGRDKRELRERRTRSKVSYAESDDENNNNGGGGSKAGGSSEAAAAAASSGYEAADRPRRSARPSGQDLEREAEGEKIAEQHSLLSKSAMANLSQEFRERRRRIGAVLSEVEKYGFAKVFMPHVRDQLPSPEYKRYLATIKGEQGGGEVMYLKLMARQLNQGVYDAEPSKAVEDINCLKLNCYVYNGKDAPISSKARHLDRMFGRLFGQWVECKGAAAAGSGASAELVDNRCLTCGRGVDMTGSEPGSEASSLACFRCTRCMGPYHAECSGVENVAEGVPERWRCPQCVERANAAAVTSSAEAISAPAAATAAAGAGSGSV